jgi:hypothetical protein
MFGRVERVVHAAPLLGKASGVVARLLGFPYQRRSLETARWVMKRLY